MDLTTACYYTWSTISQTLAGAFGIVVPVVIYRIQRVEERQVGVLITVQQTARVIADSTPTEQRDAPEYREKMTKLFADIEVLPGQRKHAITVLISSLYWTSGTILACIFLLPLTPVLVGMNWLAWFLMAGTVASASRCVWTYVALIRSITTDR